MKLVVFDLDGVLLDSKDAHFHAFNQALNQYGYPSITHHEHLAKFDGLPTAKKLHLLPHVRPDLHPDIKKAKQTLTVKYLKENVATNPKLQDIFQTLKTKGYQIAVASNSVRETIRICLNRLGVIEDTDFILSNEDVKYPKPHPEIYLRAMLQAYAGPQDTLVIEDSHVGREAAAKSGAKLLAVNNPNDLHLHKILKALYTSQEPPTPWTDNNLNVLIPMAGAGSRFQQAGYTFPKPLIEVHGKPMIQVVVENLNIKANYTFITQQEHYDTYNLKYLLQAICPDCNIVTTNKITQGAACTTLLAQQYIDNDNPLLIANSDQFIDWDSNETMYALTSSDNDAGILTFNASHPKWSYAKINEQGYVTEVAEKKVISQHATVGVYYWKKGSDYVKYAKQMIQKDIRVNNEFYVAPVFNEAIQDGKKVRTRDVNAMYGIGTPEDLNYFLSQRPRI